MEEQDQAASDTRPSSTANREIAACFDGAFVRAAEALPDTIWQLSESDLELQFKPSLNDFQIRKRLNQLADGHATGGPTIESQEIYKGICTRQNFYDRLIKNPFRMAWYLTPISSYKNAIEEGSHVAVMKMRKIMNLPETKENLPSIIKAIEFFVTRHEGPVVQKIEQKSMTMNVNRTEKDVSSLNPEEMMKRYEEVQARLRTLPATAVVADEPE